MDFPSGCFGPLSGDQLATMEMPGFEPSLSVSIGVYLWLLIGLAR